MTANNGNDGEHNPFADHNQIRSTYFHQSQPSADGSIFSAVPATLAALELPLDECPNHYRQGIQCSLTPKRLSKKSGRFFQRVSCSLAQLLFLILCQCSGNPRHIYMYPKHAASTRPVLATPVPPSSSPPPYATPQASDNETEQTTQRPVEQARRQTAKGNPYCLEDNCPKVQQASTCIHGMCVDHCSDKALREHRLDGTPIRICPSGAHQQAAEWKLQYGATPSTNPRRTRAGPIPSSAIVSEPLSSTHSVPTLTTAPFISKLCFSGSAG